MRGHLAMGAALALPVTNAVAVPQDPAAETAAGSPFTFQEVMIPMRAAMRVSPAPHKHSRASFQANGIRRS